MKIIGITGGVGSGKSTVAKIMRDRFHAHILIADDIGRTLMEKGNISYQKILENFGRVILNEEEEIDRKKLASLVFHNEEKLNLLNSCVHPFVTDYILSEIKKLKVIEPEAIVVVESAILIEVGYKEFCDEVWYVSVTKEVRRERLKLNRNYSDEQIDQIVSNQLSEEEYSSTCDRIIYNNEEEEQVIEQLQNLLE